MTMNLMSWNVDGRTDEKTLSNQLSKIESENVDILALQEVSPGTVEYIKEGLSKTGLNYVETSCDLAVDLDIQTGPHENGKVADGVLIASRWPLELIPEFFEQIPWQKSALSVIVETPPYGEIEVHTVHVPNASSSGQWKEEKGGWIYEEKGTSTTKQRGRQIKVDAFKGIYAALSAPTVSNQHCILCGDFNSPKKESNEGNMYWGTKSEHRRSEKQVIEGLKEHDLEDTYRKLHPDYSDGAYSHVNRNPNTPNRRYDHIFSSTSLNPIECDYLHPFLDLSDHSPVYAIYEPETS